MFWVCLFSTILWTHKWVPQIQKFGQKWQISPKSSKILKYWWFFKFHRQIFRVPPKVPWVWFLRSYVLYWQSYDFLKKWIFSNFLVFWFIFGLRKREWTFIFVIKKKLQKCNFFVILTSKYAKFVQNPFNEPKLNISITQNYKKIAFL